MLAQIREEASLWKTGAIQRGLGSICVDPAEMSEDDQIDLALAIWENPAIYEVRNKIGSDLKPLSYSLGRGNIPPSSSPANSKELRLTHQLISEGKMVSGIAPSVLTLLMARENPHFTALHFSDITIGPKWIEEFVKTARLCQDKILKLSLNQSPFILPCSLG